MTRIKRMGILSFGKFQAVIMAIAGLVAGILYSFGGFLIDLSVSLGLITSTSTSGLSTGTLLAFGALFGMPVTFAIFGFVAGVFEAVIYNVVAKRFGGIALDIEQ